MSIEFILLIISPFIGSFLGVVIERLPKGQNITTERSMCDQCHAVLPWGQLIPILSYVAQMGRCKQCNSHISLFYPAVEISTLLITIACVLSFDGGMLIASVFLGWMLLILAWIDWRHFVLPDVLTLPLIPIGLFVVWFSSPNGILYHSSAVIIGYASLWLVETVYKSMRGHDGLGMGDAKLFAAAGAWVGLTGLISVLLLACLSALSYVLISWLLGKQLKHDTPISFGSFLCIGMFLTWLSGDFLFGSL